MADAAARERQYKYVANANLVLQAERTYHRDEKEPTGEPESLAGKITHRMGDRFQPSKPPTEKETKKRKTKRHDDDSFMDTLKKQRAAADRGVDEKYYRPKTKATEEAYKHLLDFIQRKLGDHPPSIISGAAFEILQILNDDHLTDPRKEKEIQGLLGLHSLTVEELSKLKTYGKQITDFQDQADEMENVDPEQGISVVINEDDGEDDDDMDEIRDEESDDDDVGEEAEAHDMLAHEDKEDDEEEARDEFFVDVKDIDAFWIQRKVSSFVQDAQTAQDLADKLHKIIESDADTRLCQNQLVGLLGYERFNIASLLMHNRQKIVYGMKLRKAGSDEERLAIESAMKSDPALASVLHEFHRKKTDKATALEQSLKKEAKALSKAQELDKAAADSKKLLDLDALAFSQGGHLMSTKQCKLPEGTTRVQKKGYEEIHIPKPVPKQLNVQLRPIDSLPEWSRLAFPPREKMPTLNPVQSTCCEAALKGSENMLVCAPTGSGKTYIALLCMLQEIGLNMNWQDQDNFAIDADNFKIIYIAPMKSLVQEMVLNFRQRLEKYGIVVNELTGDSNMTKQQINETQIIVTTPEKWDIITRKSGERTFTQLVRLVIFDEIHLLHDDRGPVLESIIARTMRQVEATGKMVRMVALSATLPNYKDVADLLRVGKDFVFHFDNACRPVPLEQQFIGIGEKKALKRFQLTNDILYEKVIEKAGVHQVLVFVHSRKETAKTARAIKEMALANGTLANFLRNKAVARKILMETAEKEKELTSLDLKELLPFGFGIHHAGMNRKDRSAVEDLFAAGYLQVLFSTATLAWGVNLPAHTVIIKGTQVYNPEKGAWVELSPMDIMQMLGRAGRPGFDSEGRGILITNRSELQYYLTLMNNQLPIESQFVKRLADNLNAEIVLGTITNVAEASDWLRYTYLYICMLRSPALYGIPVDETDTDPELEAHRTNLIHSAATKLDKASLVKYNRKSGQLQATDLGRVASHYYITAESMCTFNDQLKPTMSDIELFRVFSLSSEFKYITVREEEKVELEKLLERVPIPVKESLEEPTAKVNVLLQSYISRLKLEGFALLADMVYVQQSAGRIVRALFEIALKRGWAQLATKLLALCKMVDRRMWSCQCPLRQFARIPESIVRKLEKKDFPFERMYDLNSQEIGELIHFPTQGATVFNYVHSFPRLDLAANVQPITRSTLRVELSIQPDFKWEAESTSTAEGFWVWVEDVDGEAILYHEYFVLKRKYLEEEHVLTFTVPLFDPLPPHYYITVVSDRWLASSTRLPISFRQLILPEKYPPHTELLDLQPLPVKDALKAAPHFLPLFDRFQFFNAIQTQVHQTLFGTDSNALVASPTSSGKTVCAEFAILRMLLQEEGSKKCVYIAPMEAIARTRMVDWAERFGRVGVPVVMLTGDATADMQLLRTGTIVVTTAEHWDVLSRRWRSRKPVQAVDLVIVDELHLIGGVYGPVLEVVVSRMRYMSSQIDRHIRIVALSSSLSNAKDLGDWLGASSHALYNFHPNARPVPLEIHMQGFDHAHYEARLLAMTRPMLLALQHHALETVDRGDKGSETVCKPTIIFVSSRREATRVATEVSLSLGERASPYYNPARCPPAQLKEYQALLKNKVLRRLLEFGIAFYTDGMTPREKEVIENLFAADAIRLLVATNTTAWELAASAHLVIIMGTQAYDGNVHRYVDYPVSDVLQMIGRCSRPLIDASSVCFIMCHAPKKDYYKKFLFEPLPVESHIDQALHDHINAEVVTKTVENKQDAVDYLTWTFFYRRLTQNPNYYNLTGVSHRHLSDHLSELVEATLDDLQNSRCIAEEGDIGLAPLNLGMIAAYYYIRYTTVELFSSSLTAKTRLKGLMQILCNASEYDRIPMRRRESGQLQKLGRHMPLKIDQPKYNDPHTKANVLLQCHFARKPISSDLASDQAAVLQECIRLLHAMVDVISSHGWLNPAVAAMEMCQMVVQAQWNSDSHLKQLPHFTDAVIARCREAGVQDIFDLLELTEERRTGLLQMSEAQLRDVAAVCNAYPNVDLQAEVESESVREGDSVSLAVTLTRELDEGQEVIPPVQAPFYPKEKVEAWWLVVGDEKHNQLLAIKRFAPKRQQTVRLEFPAPHAGKHTLKLFLMCDSYAGVDQEHDLALRVAEGVEEGEAMQE